MSDEKNVVENRIESLHVKGFRSLADVQLDDIPNPMVLLGANGAGKSNVLLFFQLLRALAGRRLGEFVRRRGGADDQLFGGHQRTKRIEANVSSGTDLGSHTYAVTLEGTEVGDLSFVNEEFVPCATEDCEEPNCGPQSNHESNFVMMACSKGGDDRAKAVVDLLRDAIVYQFHDTSSASPIKTRWDAEDNHRLLEHGGNLAPILIHLRRNDLPKYEMICRHIRRALPEFDGFELDVSYGKTMLRWRTKTTKQTMGAHLTSDGSLRAFCLITLLNLPDELLPRVILLDEPELGLHPFAISLVSHMVKVMARERQVIVATQSPYFVDAFSLDEIVVLTMRDGETEAKRFADGDFSHWLDEHTTGQLWWMNLLGGYP